MRQDLTFIRINLQFMRFPALFAVLLLLAAPLSAQVLHLRNASFEGEPADATVPMGWLACEPLTTPDILPGVWGVYQEASEGDTYMGLITRENNTWESVAQRLPRALPALECFSLNLDLATSRTYAGYNQPIRLRIWGGAGKCGKDQLLWESDWIKHTAWETYNVEFTLQRPVRYLILEAFYSEKPFSYRGNILIDNLSRIQPCPRADAGQSREIFIFRRKTTS